MCADVSYYDINANKIDVVVCFI